MTLADRLYWFKRDCGHDNIVIDNDADYLLSIITDTFGRIRRMGEPDDGYEQMVYDDLIDTHNRAVDLFNDLMKGGVA